VEPQGGRIDELSNCPAFADAKDDGGFGKRGACGGGDRMKNLRTSGKVEEVDSACGAGDRMKNPPLWKEVGLHAI